MDGCEFHEMITKTIGTVSCVHYDYTYFHFFAVLQSSEPEA